MPRVDLTAQLDAVALAYTLDPDSPRPLTDAQRMTLEAFTGWGALAGAFASAPTGRWLDAADRLDEILPADAFESARDQVDTSFFTPPLVTGAVLDLLAAVGFTGGAVLEPGCGSGAFLTAAAARWEVTWTGVDVDPTSTRIARLLHPTAEIITGKLERTPTRDGHFDAVIGNVPFSSVQVRDAEGRSDVLHNYFIRRAISALRPGGYAILVTSRHTLDAQHGLADMFTTGLDAAFAGAVRLPASAFSQAGTDVVTDIIAIRKNDPAHELDAWPVPADFAQVEDGYTCDWRGYRVPRMRSVDLRPQVSEPSKVGATIVDPPRVSRYWEQHRDHVAGTMLATGWARSPLTVRADDIPASIAAAVSTLADTLPPMMVRLDRARIEGVVIQDAAGRKVGSIHDVDGVLHRVQRGSLTPIRANRELSALVALRDLAVRLVDAESDPHAPEAALALLRAQALDAYEAYVRVFGHLNRGTLVEGRLDEETGLPALSWRRPAMGGFRKDPDSALVMALEEFDQETGEARPAPILLRRVNRAPEPVTRVDTPEEAVAVSVGETGRVDLDRIRGLLGLEDEPATIAALEGLIFADGDGWLTAAEFLSGNVRAKLDRARANGDQAAVTALEAVVPERLGPLQIHIGLGSPFAGTADVEAFLRDVLGAQWATVNRVPSRGVWEVSESRSSPEAAVQYGTPDAEPWYLVECALNARIPEVTDRHWDSDRRAWVSVRNVQKTAAAAEKLELIRDRFALWIWEDQDRAERIGDAYNQALNSHVPRTFTGAGLTFPGMTADRELWPHQRAAVERIVSTPRTLIGHPVGSGKTLTMVAAARTLRHFGLAAKPLIVVPNHLLEQIAREAQQAYPTGRFLIATKDDLARDARRLFAARCATGEWDAVIMTHSSFTSIPVHPDSEREWLAEQKLDLQVTLQHTRGGRKDKGPKEIARAIRALDANISKLRSGVADEDTIFFDQLGVDFIFYDEAHLARRLSTGSGSRDGNGMPSGSSKRATDLLVKVETLAARRPAGAPVVAMMTGTPWSNTLAETWVWQRFLQPDDLRDADLIAFDAWVSAFVRFETNIEVTPDASGFRLQRRPVGIVNAPELKVMLGLVADIIDPEELGIDRPDVTVRTMVVAPSDRQQEFMRTLADRADSIRDRTAAKVTTLDGREADDSMLLVCNDGRKVALDPRLVGIDEHSTKVSQLAEAVADAHHEHADRTFGESPIPGGFQLVFLDLGTPKPQDMATYGRVRAELIRRGIPAERVRFVHDARTDKARAALFASCRDGAVSVLIGSTPKVGMGTNVQTRLTHLWHMDAPWLPSDVVQRDGRGVRPHNLAGHVTITRMVTEGSFDAFTWQALERKSRSFDALYATGATAREIEDVSSATLSYGQVKALASGNPLLLDQAKAQADVRRLQLMRSVHLQSVRKAERDAVDLDRHAAALRDLAGLAMAVRAHTTTQATDEETAALASAVASWVDAEKNSSGYGLSARAAEACTWRGVVLSPEHVNSRLTAVRVRESYSTVHTIELDRRILRRGVPAVTEAVTTAAGRFLDTLPMQIERWKEDASDATAQAVEHRRVAGSAVFPDELALQAAIRRLAEIDTLIAEESAQQPEAA